MTKARASMHPDNINMWIDGVPVQVLDITAHHGRIEFHVVGGVTYSFDMKTLSRWLGSLTRRAGGGTKAYGFDRRTPPPSLSFSKRCSR